MGSGKSTVGVCLAEILGWKFVDLDREIVKREGRSIAQIFGGEGEARFREIEAAVLLETLKSAVSPAVIALGGGTFIHSANRDVLHERGALTIHLDAEFDLLFARCCAESGTRPLMQDGTRLRELFEERQPIYRSAQVGVKVAGRSPQEIAREIAEKVANPSLRSVVPE
jgi:shikimate kinase